MNDVTPIYTDVRNSKFHSGRDNPSQGIKMLALTLCALCLVACGGGSPLGDRNISVPGLSGGKSSKSQPTTVNRFLWAASLETVNFLPISTADPISGLIITDWYVNPESSGERFKVNVYILDSSLRADALRVSVFRQENKTNGWVDAGINPATSREIENAILTRARQLRLNTLE